MVIISKVSPSVHLDHIKIGGSSMYPPKYPPKSIRGLGVIMDSNDTMVYYIDHKVYESCSPRL